MFSNNKNSSDTQLEKPDSFSKDRKEPIAAKKNAEVFDKANLPEVADVKVYTMPEKFMMYKGDQESRPKQKSALSGTKKNVLIISIVGIVIVGFLALGAWFLVQSFETPQENNLLVEQKTQAIENENTNQPEEDVVPTESQIPEGTVGQDVCSAENCEACDLAECADLVDFCHLVDECLLDENFLGDCPSYICLAGKNNEVDLTQEEEFENQELVMAEDSDQDGLTDIEEDLWQTDKNNPDTDGDGYLDGEEVLNHYNPNLSGPDSKLIQSDLIKENINQLLGYSIYYPASWLRSETPEGEMFLSNSEDFINIIIQEKDPMYENAEAWYRAQNEEAGELETFTVNGLSGVKSPDGLNVYLSSDDYLYVLNYNIGRKNKLTYQTTFNMMLKSFKLLK